MHMNKTAMTKFFHGHGLRYDFDARGLRSVTEKSFSAPKWLFRICDEAPGQRFGSQGFNGSGTDGSY
jgi:hypothetical protein